MIAFFSELTEMWGECPHAPLCHYLHPRWECLRWPRLIFSRRTCSLYHQIAVGRGKLRDRLFYSRFKGIDNRNCRKGCDAIETVHHVFFDCPHYADDIADLYRICKKKRIDYDMKSLFTHPALRIRVEMFLGKIIPESNFFSF